MRNSFSLRGAALSPRARYRVLGAITALGSLQCAAFALWRPYPDVPDYLLWAAAGALAAGALVAWLALPHLSRWLIDLWVAALAVGICAAAWYGDSASDQLIAAMALSLLVVYSAYFLQLARMLVQLVWMCGLYIAMAYASPQLESQLYAGVVVVTLSALAAMVSTLAAGLASAAIRDPLTGVLNRRGLSEAAELVRAVILRADRRISVVAIDLNDFKGYNDRHGHLAGDRLLAEVAAGWKGLLRSADVLARTGGDEFVLVLADTDLASAHSLLARLHEASRVRWSAGVVEWEPGESFEDVLHEADKALYLAKTTG